MMLVQAAIAASLALVLAAHGTALSQPDMGSEMPAAPAVEGAPGPAAPPGGAAQGAPVGPVSTADELAAAHKRVTGIMEAQARGEATAPSHPFVMAYVDEAKGELVVMMDPSAAASTGEGELQGALGTSARIRTLYGTVGLDSAAAGPPGHWSGHYGEHCMPSSRDGHEIACSLYVDHLRAGGSSPAVPEAQEAAPAPGTGPVLTLPSGLAPAAPSSAGVVVNYVATARDSAGNPVPVSCEPASGSLFPIGETPVFCMAADSAGNTTWGDFVVTVTVRDTTLPAINAPEYVLADATSVNGAAVAYEATARAADGTAAQVGCEPASGSTFAVGYTDVTCTATDAAGITATHRFPVIVDPFVPASPAGSLYFSETFDHGRLARWTGSGDVPWRAAAHEGPINADGTRTNPWFNKVAQADACVAECTLELTAPMSLSGRTGATLALSRYVDAALAAGEHLKVEVHSSGAWTTLATWTHGSGDDGAWHHETYDLSGHLAGDFKVRLAARGDSASDNVAVDNVQVWVSGGAAVARDTAAPALALPAAITLAQTSPAGAAVSYTATATDAVDGTIAPKCTPASGSTFAVGSRHVECWAVDRLGNAASGRFSVTVTDAVAPVLAVPSGITAAATSDSGATVAFTATATDAVDGTLTPSCTPAGGSTFAVGETEVTCMATDRAGNSASASFTVTVTPFVRTVLLAGFESGLSGWTVSGGGWESTVPEDGSPAGSAATNRAATADSCAAECALGLATAIDLSPYASATLTFWRYVDSSLGDGDYLRVSATSHGKTTGLYEWTSRSDSRGVWVHETHSLADHLSSGFKIGFAARADAATDDVAVDTVRITASTHAPIDTVAPVITGPSSVTAETVRPTHRSTMVSFAVAATDNVDGAVTPSCSWTALETARSGASGGPFGVGTTTVTCTATDAAGNSASHAFAVTVSQGTASASEPSDVRGGVLVHAHFDQTVGNKLDYVSTTGTAGIVLEHDGKTALLVSSHVVDHEDSRNLALSGVLLYGNRPTEHARIDAGGHGRLNTTAHSAHHLNENVIGTAVLATTDATHGRTVSSDAALLHVTGADVTAHVGQIQKGATLLTPSARGGAAGLVGSEVELVGGTVTSTGVITHADATVKFPLKASSGQVVLTGQVVATYSARPGDSGAPVIRTADGTTTLLGIHVGHADEVLVDATGAVTAASPRSLDAAGVGPRQFGVFSPWESIQRDLGLG
ncbi:MAG: HYR domain-containing protein [Thaumarchaeota archaeon S13]|nr:MAG: HYR domain-containing protein [Thaumarchaeota archaeon S13]